VAEVSKEKDVDMDAVRTSVVATLMAKEYGPRMHRLEQKCIALSASNQKLQADAATAQARSERTRDLNRRLCREVNEARSERTVAFEELEQLKQQVERFQREAKQARCENAALREALRASQQHVVELSRSQSDSCGELAMAPAQPESFPSMGFTGDAHFIPSDESGPDPALLMVPVSHQELQTCDGDHTMCSCTNNCSWGCTFHRVYSDSLLLAHREIAARISHGPPGLEPEIPPGLECNLTGANLQQHGFYMVPA